MSRNRYVGDYHLADSLDERGKIRTDVEYVGDRYSFTEGPETVRRAKRKALILCAAGWLLYIGAMILPSAAMRALWTAVPFAFTGVPLALLTGTAAEIYPRKERFEHRYADRIENRWPAASAFTVILAGISLAGEGVNLLLGKEMKGGDALFAACAAGLILVGILAHRTRRSLRCEKTR